MAKRPQEPDIFDRPVPGQSLTDEPGNYPWEHPPQYTDLREARDRIFDGMTKPENAKQLITMLASDVPVEAIVRTVLFAGFTEGKWTVDMATLLAPVVLIQIVSMAKAAKLEKFRMLLEEQPDDFLPPPPPVDVIGFDGKPATELLPLTPPAPPDAPAPTVIG